MTMRKLAIAAAILSLFCTTSGAMQVSASPAGQVASAYSSLRIEVYREPDELLFRSAADGSASVDSLVQVIRDWTEDYSQGVGMPFEQIYSEAYLEMSTDEMGGGGTFEAVKRESEQDEDRLFIVFIVSDGDPFGDNPTVAASDHVYRGYVNGLPHFGDFPTNCLVYIVLAGESSDNYGVRHGMFLGIGGGIYTLFDMWQYFTELAGRNVELLGRPNATVDDVISDIVGKLIDGAKLATSYMDRPMSILEFGTDTILVPPYSPTLRVAFLKRSLFSETHPELIRPDGTRVALTGANDWVEWANVSLPEPGEWTAVPAGSTVLYGIEPVSADWFRVSIVPPSGFEAPVQYMPFGIDFEIRDYDNTPVIYESVVPTVRIEVTPPGESVPEELAVTPFAEWSYGAEYEFPYNAAVYRVHVSVSVGDEEVIGVSRAVTVGEARPVLREQTESETGAGLYEIQPIVPPDENMEPVIIHFGLRSRTGEMVTPADVEVRATLISADGPVTDPIVREFGEGEEFVELSLVPPRRVGTYDIVIELLRDGVPIEVDDYPFKPGTVEVTEGRFVRLECVSAPEGETIQVDDLESTPTLDQSRFPPYLYWDAIPFEIVFQWTVEDIGDSRQDEQSGTEGGGVNEGDVQAPPGATPPYRQEEGTGVTTNEFGEWDTIVETASEYFGRPVTLEEFFQVQAWDEHGNPAHANIEFMPSGGNPAVWKLAVEPGPDMGTGRFTFQVLLSSELREVLKNEGIRLTTDPIATVAVSRNPNVLVRIQWGVAPTFLLMIAILVGKLMIEQHKRRSLAMKGRLEIVRRDLKTGKEESVLSSWDLGKFRNYKKRIEDAPAADPPITGLYVYTKDREQAKKGRVSVKVDILGKTELEGELKPGDEHTIHTVGDDKYTIILL